VPGGIQREVADLPSAQASPSTTLTFRDVTGTQWAAFFAAFLGWLLDGFDFSILTFLLIDIGHTFTVDKALAGALGTVTLMFRLIGGLSSGTAADRFGRKTPLILCIVWISLFSLLSGLSTSYAMLFACRALFGIGMGGVWASGLPLALEHWPKNLRGTASGLLMGGFNWGFMLAAIIYQVVSPLVVSHGSDSWRYLFYIAACPVILVFWIWKYVKESPVWLAHRDELKKANQHEGLSIFRIFQRDLIGVTAQTTIMMAAFMISYYSIIFWYPTLLREAHIAPLKFLIALNGGGIIGTAVWGRISETRLGRRGAIACAAIGSTLAAALYVLSTQHPTYLLLGALLMGFCGIGAWGMAPSYLTERFPTAVRAVGPGFSYHAGAFVGSLTPLFIGRMQDHHIALSHAMFGCIAVAGLLIASSIWLGPETRGQGFTTAE
jgi:SHS family lactate transporter-like MFS transporter